MPLGSKGIIFLMKDKVWWHVSNGKEVKDYFQLQILKDKIPDSAKTIAIHARNRYFENYQTQNVIGYVPGRNDPDSFFVFTAHYDHLGQMGSETFFPGANDNASGTAMLLDLARSFFTTQKPTGHFCCVYGIQRRGSWTSWLGLLCPSSFIPIKKYPVPGQP